MFIPGIKKSFPALLAASLIFFAAGCRKDTDQTEPVTPATGIILSFSNVADTVPLTLNSATYNYVNANGDSFNVTTYKYYISNVSFTDANNNTWSEPESYHLVNAADPNSLNVSISGIPAGNYTSIHFMIGVDSTRNVSGAQTGALDPANDMFWTWNTGYIMAKFEGKSPSSTAAAHSLTFHIGGYGGANATQQWVTSSFGSQTANVTTSVIPVVHISSNMLEWFRSPSVIDFSTTNSVASPGNNALTIAHNYADMFTVTGITN
ncbi:MAG TPA: MbnP family protein [Bacteroidia bacterium]|nr:MbnP family protein [Bacteroidia bacterium]